MADRGVPLLPVPRVALPPAFTIDVAHFSPKNGELAILCVRSPDPRAREHWMLPSTQVRTDSDALDVVAQRLATETAGAPPSWIEQTGAFGHELRHTTDATLSVGYAAVLPASGSERTSESHAWFGVKEPPQLAPRQRAILDAGVAALRTRMDHSPIAFRLLPPLFTLSELQQMYELLMGTRLHKASFRRALQAAALVEATDEWRSEGRGRPAQYFRYAPRKRRGVRRGVRFDLLG